MLYGIGAIGIGTNTLDANSLFGMNVFAPQCVAGVSFSVETSAVTANCFKNGSLQKVASKVNSEQAMVELTYEYLSWTELQMLYGEMALSGGAAVPTVRSEKASGDNTITLTDVNTDNNNVASLRLFNSTDEKFMKLVASAPTAGQYTIASTTTETVITLHSSAANKIFAVKYDKIYSSIESIGSGTDTTQKDYFDNLNLTAVVSSSIYPKGLLLVVDRLERTNSPTLQLTGDKATLSIQYDVLTLPGRAKGYTLYKLDGATSA